MASTMFLRCNTKASCCPSGVGFFNRQAYHQGHCVRAAASATLSVPTKEAHGSDRPGAASLGRSEPLTQQPEQACASADTASSPAETVAAAPSATGWDFNDLLDLPEHVVKERMHMAVAYRSMCDSVSASGESFPGPSNLHQLTSYRDNVTRNLAPSVAWGFANVTRTAGRKAAASASQSRPAPVQAPQQSPQQQRVAQQQRKHPQDESALAAQLRQAFASAAAKGPHNGHALPQPQHQQSQQRQDHAHQQQQQRARSVAKAALCSASSSVPAPEVKVKEPMAAARPSGKPAGVTPEDAGDVRGHASHAGSRRMRENGGKGHDPRVGPKGHQTAAAGNARR